MKTDLREALKKQYPIGVEFFKYSGQKFVLNMSLGADNKAYVHLEGDYRGICGITIDLVEQSNEYLVVKNSKIIIISGFPLYIIDYDHAGIIICKLGEK